MRAPKNKKIPMAVMPRGSRATDGGVVHSQTIILNSLRYSRNLDKQLHQLATRHAHDQRGPDQFRSACLRERPANRCGRVSNRLGNEGGRRSFISERRSAAYFLENY